MSFDQENGLTWTSDLGDNEDLRSLLLDFRKFVSDDEDTFYYKIANIVEVSIPDVDLKAANRTNREGWKQVLTGDIQLHVNGVNYDRERCFKLLVNGKWFHSSAELEAEYDGLPAEFQSFILANVNALAIKSINVLVAERNLIREAFRRRDQAEGGATSTP